MTDSDVKRGKKPRDRGQSYEADANFWRLRPRPRPKIIIKKYQIIINNIRFKIIAGKINKIPEFYTIFARKMLNYIIRQRDQGQAEAKCFEAEAKILASRQLWPQGLNITGD